MTVPPRDSIPLKRRLPRLGTIVLVLIWILLISFSVSLAFNDRQGSAERFVTNVVVGYLLVSATFVWCLRRAPMSRGQRLGIGLAYFGLPFLIPLFFQIDGFTGGMRPTITPRWALPHDARLEQLPTGDSETLADLTSTTDYDFPQFLGKHRDGSVDHRGLKFPWQERLPVELWRTPIGAGWSGFVVVNGFAVTMEQRGDEELTTCREVATGKVIWSSSESARHATFLGGVGPRSTPTIHQGRVYCLGATGILKCLDGSNGAVIWRHNLLGEHAIQDDSSGVAWGRSGSPLVVDDTVVVPVGGPHDGEKHSLIAYDLQTGEERWRGGKDQVSYASPALAVLDGHRQIVTVVEHAVLALDAETGTQLWRFPWPGSSTTNANASQAVAVGANEVFVSKGYGGGATLFRVNRETPEAAWQTEEVWHFSNVMKTKFSNVVVFGDHVYGLDDILLECIELPTGRKRWKQRFDYGQVLLVGDVLLAQSEAGEIVAVRAIPDGYEELGRFAALDGKCWNNLCVYQDYLLVRNSEVAACYQLE